MKKCYLGIICLLYALIIVYVWFSNSLRNFLAPNMQIYLKCSFIPLIIMGLILIVNKGHYKFKVSDLVLLLPLFMLIMAGDGRLSSNFAKNRMTTFKVNEKVSNKNEKKDNTNIVVTPKLDIEVEEDNKVEEYNFSNPYFDITDKSYDVLANYITFEKKATKYIGKTIRVRGFAVTDAEYLSNDYFAIGKYAITCCAADANFSGFIVKYDKSKIENNKWYMIEGVIEEGIYNKNEKIQVIRVINLTEIDGKKEEQYVYPCYAYDDGVCTELHKYDLEY